MLKIEGGSCMQEVLELTDLKYSSFVEKSDNVIFIDFYSDTCPPCQTLLSYLPNIAEHYADENVQICKVNVAKNPKLANKFMVQSVPLTVVIGRDKMVKKAQIGLQSIESYTKMIDKELGKKIGFFSRLFK